MAQQSRLGLYGGPRQRHAPFVPKPEVVIIPGEIETFTAILTLTPGYDSVRTINHVFAGLFDAQAAEGVLD